jgi:hypothetical protein
MFQHNNKNLPTRASKADRDDRPLIVVFISSIIYHPPSNDCANTLLNSLTLFSLSKSLTTTDFHITPPQQFHIPFPLIVQAPWFHNTMQRP